MQKEISRDLSFHLDFLSMSTSLQPHPQPILFAPRSSDQTDQSPSFVQSTNQPYHIILGSHILRKRFRFPRFGVFIFLFSLAISFPSSSSSSSSAGCCVCARGRFGRGIEFRSGFGSLGSKETVYGLVLTPQSATFQTRSFNDNISE